MTELQLKNESLAARLRDEVANQKEIQKKLVQGHTLAQSKIMHILMFIRISSTRDLCTALKDHTVKLDQALCQTEDDKASLVQLDTNRKQQFQV